MRRSLRVLAAWSTACCAAFSHDSVLVPTSSITLYTLSGICLASFFCNLWFTRIVPDRQRRLSTSAWIQRGTVCYPQGVCVRLTMPSIYPGTPISRSFFSLDSFLTLLSTFNAKLLVPNLFWNTKVKGPLLLRYFDPLSRFPWCWANRR